MVNNQSELEFEHIRLEETVALAKKQLKQARERNEDNKSAIISTKKEMRDNSSHAISNLWSNDGFEALAEMSQYANEITLKIEDFESVERRINVLKNMIKAPYFARIDFKFEDGDKFEKIYIGRASLENDNSFERYIYDWRAPIASVFYRFVLGEVFYDAPMGRIKGEVKLKRQYEISNGILDYFFNTEVQIVDEFLRKLLSQNSSPKMKTIVETIQKDQDIVIRDMENDLMIVQGVAGSGKTSIALHRVAYLMYQGLSNKLSSNNIMIISPNSLFEKYISSVLPELGENNVVSVVFEEMLTNILQNEQIQSKNNFLENLITSPRQHKVIKNSIEFKTSHKFMKILDCFIADLPNRWIDFEDVYYEGKYIVSKEMLREKILSRAETPIGMKLKQLEAYILDLLPKPKKGRIYKTNKHLVKIEIQKFTELNVLNLYKNLFNDKEYFYSLMNGFENREDLDEILKFTRENLNDSMLYYDDAIVLAYLNLKIFGNNAYKKIKQVVIDEAQDYYPLQYEIFNLLFSKSKFTILGDVNQTLEKHENLSIYKQISKILNKEKSSLITMDKSFRCTNEILNFSLKFIKQIPEIKSFNRKGDEPKICSATDQVSLNDMILTEVNTCLEKGYQSIGLICKTEKNAIPLFESLKDKINVQLITSESISDLKGVFIIPVYMSKGLEFDAVLICDADVINYNKEDDKTLLHIASTRALHRLNLFCLGEISPLL